MQMKKQINKAIKRINKSEEGFKIYNLISKV